jgi:hypothetical protein
VRRALILLAVLVGSAGCKQELKPEQVQLLDAMMYAVTGVEENSAEKYGLTPWLRQVTDSGIELSLIAKNGIGWSDEKMNAIRRKSVFIRYVKKMSSPKPCTFRLEDSIEFSVADSKSDFSAYRMETGSESYIFDLNKAYKFVVEDSGRVVIEGPAAVCWIDDGCEDSFQTYYFDTSDDDDPDKPSLQLTRRSAAVAFIKKACPGKPF